MLSGRKKEFWPSLLSVAKSLVNTCSLTIPLSKDSYRLQTDASGTGIGAVLSVVWNDEESPVAFYSRTSEEQN